MGGDGDKQGLDVVGQHVVAAEQQGVGLGRPQQRDAGARRQAYPHAGLLLPNTKTVAERVIVLPTGTALPPDAIEVIASVFRVLGAARARA